MYERFDHITKCNPKGFGIATDFLNIAFELSGRCEAEVTLKRFVIFHFNLTPQFEQLSLTHDFTMIGTLLISSIENTPYPHLWQRGIANVKYANQMPPTVIASTINFGIDNIVGASVNCNIRPRIKIRNSPLKIDKSASFFVCINSIYLLVFKNIT